MTENVLLLSLSEEPEATSLSVPFFAFNFWPCHVVCRIWVSPSGVEPPPPVLEARSLSPWTTGKSPMCALPTPPHRGSPLPCLSESPGLCGCHTTFNPHIRDLSMGLFLGLIATIKETRPWVPGLLCGCGCVTVVVQLLSRAWLFVTPWIAAHQASLSITNSWSPLSRWCHPTISSSVAPFSFCLQSFSASGSFPMSWLFGSGGQSIGASASASVIPANIQGWFPLGWTSLTSLQWMNGEEQVRGAVRHLLLES